LTTIEHERARLVDEIAIATVAEREDRSAAYADGKLPAVARIVAASFRQTRA
jgi:hypothetical protein